MNQHNLRADENIASVTENVANKTNLSISIAIEFILLIIVFEFALPSIYKSNIRYN